MKSTSRATLLIALFFILSKILGLLRIVALGNRFGAGEQMDIFVASLRIPDLLFNLLILGTLSVAFIPVFVEYLQKDKAESSAIASTIFNFTLIVMGVFSVLGIIFAPFLTKIIAPGFGELAKEQTSEMMRILMLSPFFFSLSSVLTSILHSHKRFLLAAIAPLFYNLSIIFGVFYLVPRIGFSGLAWGAVIGAFLHFFIQFPSVWRTGLLSLRRLDFSHRGVREIAKLFIPRIFGIDLGQVSLLIASIIGSTLAAGSVSVIYFAYDLGTVPLGIFAISFAVASFPTFSEYVGKGDINGFRQFFSKTAVQILFFIIPISVLFLLLRAQIVRLIPGAMEGTSFDFEDTKATAQALGFFTLSMFAQALIPLLARGFYAFKNTMTPVIAGLVSTVINISLALWLTRFLGPESMALAFSLASVVNMLILLTLLHRRLNGLNDDYLLLRTIKISVATVTMGISVYLTLYIVAPFVDMSTYFGVLIQAVSAGIVGLSVYLVSGLVIKLPETYDIVRIIQVWFNRLTRPVTAVVINLFTDLR